MSIDNAIVKYSTGQSLKILREKSAALRRGLHDTGARPRIEHLLSRIDTFFATADYEQVITLCDEILQIDLFNLIAHYYKGLSYEYLFQFDEALIWLDKTDLIEPGNADILAHKGACLLITGQEMDAIACFDEALEINPDNTIALYYKGSIAIDEEEALSYWETILKKEPNEKAILAEKADCLMALGRYREAIDAFKKALDYELIQRKQSDAFYTARTSILLHKLSDCMYRLGRYKEAYDSYKKLLLVDPENIYAEKGLNRCKAKLSL